MVEAEASSGSSGSSTSAVACAEGDRSSAGPQERDRQEAAYQVPEAPWRATTKLVVGVNAFQNDEEGEIETLYVGDEVAESQTRALDELRARRDAGAVGRTLDALRRGAEGTENTMPLLLDCVRAYCTVGEISDALREVYGCYEEPAVF